MGNTLNYNSVAKWMSLAVWAAEEYQGWRYRDGDSNYTAFFHEIAVEALNRGFSLRAGNRAWAMHNLLMAIAPDNHELLNAFYRRVLADGSWGQAYTERNTLMQYSLTMQDIHDYLAALQDEDVVGTTGEGDRCFAANAIKHKYPGVMVGVAWYNVGARVNNEFIDFPEDVTNASDTFDGMERIGDKNGSEITKAELRVLMPELFD